MFDLISGETRHPFHGRTVASQVVSIAVHSTVLSAVSVARVIDWPSTGMFDVACPFDVPVTAEVIVT